jgi:hypothetical protein
MYKLLIRPVIALAFALAATVVEAAPVLHRFEPGSMERIVASMKGKPFVLVVWSLDCEFCHTSLETLARERQKRKDLEVVTISTDPADDPTLGPMMKARLTSLGMAGHAWAFGSLPPERLRYAIDPKWYGEKPRSYWFDARGERTAYSGIITRDVISRLFRP